MDRLNNVASGSNLVEPKQGELSTAVKKLDNAVSVLSEQFGNLASKLIPVLRSTQPKAETPQGDTPFQTGAAQEIHTQVKRLEEIADYILDTFRRLEL